MNSLALLSGMLLVPIVMLAMGHRFRRLGQAWRRVFWGLVTGYGAALVLVPLAMLAPPVLWAPDSSLRTFLVYWGLLLLPLAGAAGARFLPGAAVTTERA